MSLDRTLLLVPCNLHETEYKTKQHKQSINNLAAGILLFNIMLCHIMLEYCAQEFFLSFFFMHSLRDSSLDDIHVLLCSPVLVDIVESAIKITTHDSYKLNVQNL
ncbi:CLUMA_CG017129, isoform A [Clunio marinus]|uniref:CLUMA_CG017129, isoform A n=1 Tax=Clunio marinus TaxID=568069 RepID=A0A1J1IUS9_9DIPT|nr:CLUMA_CG017129, isoform A [Clunio marinus]